MYYQYELAHYKGNMGHDATSDAKVFRTQIGVKLLRSERSACLVPKGNVFFLCRCAVVSSDIIELSASFRFAVVSNGCCSGAYGERLGV